MSEDEDRGARSVSPEFLARLNARLEASMGSIVGRAQQRMWKAEDGYYVAYTTTRVQGGPDHGKFLVQVFKPVGKGARTAPQQWTENYRRQFSTRKAAKKRALTVYGQHSPTWLAKNQEWLNTL